MMCWHRNRINGRRLGTARPFPLWRLHSGPQSSSVDQYSETPPEHLESSVADAMRRSVVTHHRRRIKKINHSMTGVIWLDRSLVRGPSFQISSGATILGRLRHSSRFLNESVYARASEIANKRPRFLRGQFDKGECITC